MQAAKRIQSRALSQMAAATKRYPRFFHPHEVQAVADIDDSWETVDGEDPDVFLIPSGLSVTRAVPAASTIARQIEDLADESGIYDVGSVPPPRNSGARRSEGNAPFRQPSRPDYALDPFHDLVPTPSLLIAPEVDLFSVGTVEPHQMTAAIPVMADLPPASQPLSGYMPNSMGASVLSVGRPPPSLLATMGPRKQRPIGMYVAAIGAFALAAMGIFGGAQLVHGKRLALPHWVATSKPAETAPAAAPPPPASGEAPTMDLGAALASTTLGSTPAPVAAPAAPVAKAPPAPAAPAKQEPAGVRAKAALAAGDLSEASLLYAEMMESAPDRLEGAVGLAEVARARGDSRGAAARYKEILVNYPAYLPARLGLADATWDSGDEDGARAQYVALQNTYAARMLPPRVMERSHP